MAAKKTRVKNLALVSSPQSMDECATYINDIGRINREIAANTAAMNDEIAEVTERYNANFNALKLKLKELQSGVQCWCEANRDVLTNGGKAKSGYFVTGSVQWRQKPPSVTVTGVDAVISVLKSMGLGRFVRTKEEVNKDAILNEKDAIKGVPGLVIKSGVEEFVIEPFEQDYPK